MRDANVSTTATYYIKTAADDVRNAMTKLGNVITTTPAKATTEKLENPKSETLGDIKSRSHDRTPYAGLRR